MVVYIKLEIFKEGPPYKLAGLQPNSNFNFFLGFWGPDAVRASGTPFLTDRNFNLVTPYIL